MHFELLDDPAVVATIDVFELPSSREGELLGHLRRVLDAALGDPDFLAGALHRSLPPLAQPLVWLGAVPLRSRFLALYGRWRADGHRQGFVGRPETRARLAAGATTCPAVERLLATPEESLYVPTLLDASGELCPDQDDCPAGRDRGPIIDDARPNPRAQFINIFRTTPDRQQGLLEATYRIMPIARKHPGYLRTALHRGLDGTRVANYGQYRDVGQIRRMYFRGRTFRAFGELLFLDVTEPWTLCGRPVRWRGVPLGTIPRLRCYTVDRVAFPPPRPA